MRILPLPLPLLLPLVAGCDPLLSFGPDLDPFTDLALFADRSGGACVAQPVAAYGGPYDPWEAATVVGDGDLLYVVSIDSGDDVAWLSILDVSDPKAATPRGELRFPLKGWTDAASVEDGLLVVGGARPSENALVFDVSDPDAPELLVDLDLGSDGAPTAFACDGDVVYTDGGDFHALDVSDPTQVRGITFAGVEPFGSPVLHGGELLSAGGGGGECWIDVYTPGAPPKAVERVPVPACLGSGLVSAGDAVIAVGLLEGAPHAGALVDGTAGWVATNGLSLPLEGIDGVVAHGGGAVVAGGHGGFGAVRVDVVDGRLTRTATWSPRPGFVEHVASAGGIAWVAYNRESGEFDGVVGLDFGGCP